MLSVQSALDTSGTRSVKSQRQPCPTPPQALNYSGNDNRGQDAVGSVFASLGKCANGWTGDSRQVTMLGSRKAKRL